ncbi:AAA family ATPase [Cupriavidus campinensis]
MLTRLCVRGFKSLQDVEVLFGPFNCIAGVNGVGKSNLFDAILFLMDLADMPIMAAASRIRNRPGNTASIESLFTKTTQGIARRMEFEAEFIVPPTVTDDFGREGQPTVTHLRYNLVLHYTGGVQPSNSEGIELVEENLTYIKKGESRQRLGFPGRKEFFDSVYIGASRNDFITTEVDNGRPVARIKQDKVQGPPVSIPLSHTQRTILSSINTIDKPTALAARREMQSWVLLQLEPSALRQPDDFVAQNKISSSGAHLPSTLAKLGCYPVIANKLSELIPDVGKIDVDIDEKRQLRTLILETRDGLRYQARSLSDGTLRFLALAIIGEDRESGRVICLEEPENGIHPARIPAMMRLLKEMVVDTNYAVGDDNPLRQVIINTHSPQVVSILNKNDLIVSKGYRKNGATLTQFVYIGETWRQKNTTGNPVAIGDLLEYLRTRELDQVEGGDSVKVFVKEQLQLFPELNIVE